MQVISVNAYATRTMNAATEPTATAAPPTSQDRFRQQLVRLTAEMAAARPGTGTGLNLDRALQDWLNQHHGPGTPSFEGLRESCVTGVAEGWLCQREAGGLRYGRVFKPADDLQGCSVDVVDMTDVAGPHHTHPSGEIDLILPLDADARFDGQPAGWLVLPPGSAHRPTVSQGRALVLYLLPQGQIQFS